MLNISFVDVELNGETLEPGPWGKVNTEAYGGTQMLTAAKLTIGEAAAAAGLTRKAVRVYEAKGLLPPAGRTATGYRIYDHQDVKLLAFIRRARRLGLHLDDIRQIIVIRNGGASPCAAVRDMVDDRITEIDDTVQELLSLRRSLINTRRDADDCCADDRPSAICSAIDETESEPHRGEPVGEL